MCEACSSEGLEWRETDVSREADAPGVAHERTRTRNKAKELRDQLVQHFERSNQPVWVAVQNRGEHDPETSIGRALGTKLHDKPGSVGRVRYDKGHVP